MCLRSRTSASLTPSLGFLCCLHIFVCVSLFLCLCLCIFVYVCNSFSVSSRPVSRPSSSPSLPVISGRHPSPALSSIAYTVSAFPFPHLFGHSSCHQYLPHTHSISLYPIPPHLHSPTLTEFHLIQLHPIPLLDIPLNSIALQPVLQPSSHSRPSHSHSTLAKPSWGPGLRSHRIRLDRLDQIRSGQVRSDKVRGQSPLEAERFCLQNTSF